MSVRDATTPTPSGQGQNTEDNVYERIREFIASLGLCASDELIHHAGDTTHEDLKVIINPQDRECSVTLTAESQGTLTPASSVRSAPDRLPSLVTPFNFGAVLPGCVYRSSYPKEENYRFLKELGIKTILTLVPEPLSPEYQSFMKEAGIQHFHAHIRANKGEVRIESCEMSRALRLIMDRTNHPILVHCNKGKHRTGCTIASFRRILGVDPETVREEYHTYAGPKARFLDEVFFENFDLNLVMWIARQEGWVAPQIDIAPPTPPASITSSVGAKTIALA
ncbi:tyrosine phosphatase family [Pyrenophora seminiperda CCB06]|uniref:Tyrosine phosphatase family n=1 Tax=Pyrenophora seminiperda CCB06 TaxID=1302712 RepID=A0A3M7LV10_9PLEO|nr:tyrosine phosphatase family [Pyrenophora seminiperda CCB06]